VVLAALPLLLIAGCASGDRLPSAVQGSPPPTTVAPAPQKFTCPAAEVETDGSTPKTYEPDGPLPSPGNLPAGSTMAEIRDRGALRIGVSADTLLFGARNPLSGEIEGFDIDMLKEVAKAIFGVGDDDAAYDLLDFVVIPYSQRIPQLRSGGVDIVSHTMTINCVRWQQIAFSSEYYKSGQRVLVEVTSPYTSIDDLDAAGATVCVPDGSTNQEKLADYPAIKAVAVADISDCLVALQAGEVQAITGDDTVLAGLGAQDPSTAVVGASFTAEPYGLGMPAERVDFVKFVNALLDEMRTDGRWQSIYDRWLLGTLGPQTPPSARYGRLKP